MTDEPRKPPIRIIEDDRRPVQGGQTGNRTSENVNKAKEAVNKLKEKEK